MFMRRLAVRVTRYVFSLGAVNNPDLKLKDSESGESLGLNELQINRNLLYESNK